MVACFNAARDEEYEEVVPRRSPQGWRDRRGDRLFTAERLEAPRLSSAHRIDHDQDYRNHTDGEHQAQEVGVGVAGDALRARLR
jgi:hypothetical protein